MQINKKECNYLDIARVIGIYLVILGHFPYSGDNLFYKNIIYAFHMPLFFCISGILHKHVDFSKDGLRKIIVSLIIPFFIYNIIYLPMALFFPGKEYTLTSAIKTTLLATWEINNPTWFFIALFGVKVISLFLKRKYMYIIASIVSIILLIVVNIYQIPLTNLFRIKAVLAAFPFFSLGYLFKDKLDTNMSLIFKILIIVLSGLFIYWFVSKYHRVNLGSGEYHNIFGFYLAGILGSVSVIYFSQIIYNILHFEFIKTISRGTMMVVGLHWFITDLFKLYMPDIHFGLSIVFSLIITLLFYFPIKWTYSRTPILFGKMQ